jgi:hypothetical protein
MSDSKRGKCERCCPDGGAIFSAAYGGDLQPVWRCNNCNFAKPRTSYKRASSSPTPSQTKVLARLLKRTGAVVVKQEMIGRRLWVSFATEGSIFTNKEYMGTIGPKGAINLTYYYFGGSRKVTEEYLVN